MNLADLLSYADIQQLSRIAETYDCQCDGHSKNELIQSILSKLSRRDVFESQVTELTMEDLRFLDSLLFDLKEAFSLEELVARIRQSRFSQEQSDAVNPRELISKFKHRGWLFNGYSHQTKYLFQVPQDLKRRFSDTLAAQFERRLTFTGNPSVFRDEWSLFGEDVLRFLRVVADLAPALTAGGCLYKRSQQQVMERLAVPEESLPKGGWRFGYGRRFRDYPNRFALLYDYCYYRGWIAEQPGRLELTDAGRERLAEGAPESLKELYRFWLRVYKVPICNLQAIVHWIDRLARRWVTVESLGQLLCPLIKPFYYDTSESIFEAWILLMMIHLGLVRIGEDESFGRVAMMNGEGSRIIRGNLLDESDSLSLDA